MDGFWIIVIFVLIGTVVAAINHVVATNKKKEELSKEISNMSDFVTTQELMGEDGLSGIAIDECSKKICLIRRHTATDALQDYRTAKERGASSEELKIMLNTTGVPTKRVINYRDLLSCEVCEDGVAVTRTSRTSQIGSALIGGLAFGGLGAVVGSLTGKHVSADKVTRVDLVIVVNDSKSPIHKISLLLVEVSKSSTLYRQAADRATHWAAVLEVLIRQADSEDVDSNALPAGGRGGPAISSGYPIASVADEIKKLADLRETGVLTDDEFVAQKRRLLNPED